MIKQSFSAQNCSTVALNEQSGTLMRWSDKQMKNDINILLLLTIIIVIYVFHVCYDEDMMFQRLCSRGTRLLLARHFCLWAWNMLYHFAQNIPIPKNGHKSLKLYTEDNNEENKGAQTSFWSSLNWENRTSKNETCSITYKLTVSSAKGLYSNNHI